jgi:hypothetical protein
MAYIYKTILRAENAHFIYCQNKANSKESELIAVDHKTKELICTVAIIENKTGKAKILPNHFKEKTIKKLINHITPTY